jgi:predicted protein tyrosine phosphatase
VKSSGESAQSPLDSETKRLSEAYDGVYWNQVTPGRRRASQLSGGTANAVSPSPVAAPRERAAKKAKATRRRVPLARYLASQLDGDYWNAGAKERRRMVSSFVDRSFADERAASAASAAAAEAANDDDDDDDDADADDETERAVLITRSVVESPAVARSSASSAGTAAAATARPTQLARDGDSDDGDAGGAAAAADADLNADVSDDEENDDYDEKGNLLYSVPPSERVGLNDGMDGLYWLLSGDVRPRRSRQVHTYGADHIPWAGRKKAATILTPEQEAARREQQQRRQAEERAAREKSLEAYLERVRFESEGFPIAERLWLGSRHVIANQTWMRASGIDSVLNLTTKTFFYSVANRDALQVVTVPIEDSGHAADSLLSELNSACDAIDRWLAGGRSVLVHCQHGLSRSPAVLIAYLVARRNYTLQDAYDHVSTQRRGLRINDGFLRALMKWELDARPTLARSTLKSFHRGGKGMDDGADETA